VEDEVIAGHGSGLDEGVPVEVVASETDPEVRDPTDGRTTHEPVSRGAQNRLRSS